MKRYLTSFFLSVLLSFLVMVLVLVTVAVPTVLSSSTYVNIVKDTSLSEKIYNEITMHFVDLSGSSNIPVSVFEGTVSKEAVEGVVPAYTKSLMDYAFNKTDEIKDVELDLGAVESAIKGYFETFAVENNITLDDAFYNQRDLTVREVKDSINEYAKMSILKKGANIIRPYSEKIGLYSVILGVVLSILVLVSAVLIIRTHYSHSLYWITSAVASACLILLTVFGLAQVFNFFDGFIISQITVKTIVVGVLEVVANRMVIVSALALVVCMALLCYFLKLRVYKSHKTRYN